MGLFGTYHVYPRDRCIVRRSATGRPTGHTRHARAYQPSRPDHPPTYSQATAVEKSPPQWGTASQVPSQGSSSTLQEGPCDHQCRILRYICPHGVEYKCGGSNRGRSWAGSACSRCGHGQPVPSCTCHAYRNAGYNDYYQDHAGNWVYAPGHGQHGHRRPHPADPNCPLHGHHPPNTTYPASAPPEVPAPAGEPANPAEPALAPEPEAAAPPADGAATVAKGPEEEIKFTKEQEEVILLLKSQGNKSWKQIALAVGLPETAKDIIRQHFQELVKNGAKVPTPKGNQDQQGKKGQSEKKGQKVDNGENNNYDDDGRSHKEQHQSNHRHGHQNQAQGPPPYRGKVDHYKGVFDGIRPDLGTIARMEALLEDDDKYERLASQYYNETGKLVSPEVFRRMDAAKMRRQAAESRYPWP